MATNSDTRLGDVLWGEFSSLINGIRMPVGNNNQPDRQEPNSGQNQSNNNKSSATTTYLDELEKIQEKLKDALKGFTDDIDQKRRDIRSQFNEYQKEEKEIAKKKEALQKALLENEKANNELVDGQYKDFLETRNKQIQAELTLLEEEEKYAKEKAKFANKEIENEAIRTKIRTQNFEHEQDLERRRLEFQEAHLEKTQAIADKELELQQIKQEYELKGYNSNGKKNSGAEMYKAFGEMKSYFKGNSLGRIVGDSLAGATNKAAKGMSFIAGGKIDVSAMADKMSGALAKAGPYGAAAGGLIQILKTAFEMYSKVNTAASKFARTVGGGANTIRDMEKHMAGVADHLSNANNLMPSFNRRAYDAAKLIETMSEYSAAIGRNTQYMSEQSIGALQDLKDYGISMDVLSQFDTFGLATDTVSKKLAELYSESGQRGLNAKAVTDTMVKNMKMAQNYTFAGGLRALERMAQKSVELKYNLESVSRFADKVSTLEGATQAGAGLSVLGGNFARMGNPLTMLYGGLQDPEVLNEMMLNMTKGMAYYDKQKGHMDITSFQRLQLKAAAEQMGVDYSDLYNQAMRQGTLGIVDRELDKTSGKLDDRTREFIRNIAEIRDNKAVVSLKTGKKDEFGEDIYETKEVSSLNEQDKARLAEASRDKKLKEGATIGDLITQTRSTQEKLDEIIEQIKTKLVRGVMGIFNWLDRKWGQGRNQIDLNTVSLSEEQKSDYELLKKFRDNPTTPFSATEQDRLKTQFNISSGSQLEGLTNEQLSNYAATGNKIIKKAYGGIVRGKGTSTSDSIPARLSNGEFVMNAKATSRHLPQLQAMNAEGFSEGSVTPIRAGENQMKHITVEVYKDKSQSAQSSTHARMSMEPITINIGGTIRLDAGNGFGKDVDASKLLTNDFVNRLLREIEVATHNSLDKANVRMKYPS